MSINTLYVPLFTIEEVINDKDTGLPLSGGVVTFYRDAQRQTPKEVFQIEGSSPDYTFTSLGNELTLGICGSFVDLNGNPMVPYAYPYDDDGDLDLYFVRVVSEGNVAQFTREAVPYVNTDSSPGDNTSEGNALCNPQFVEINFPSSGVTTLTVTGSNTATPLAPGWDLITSGSGTVDVERLQPTAGDVPTNPPYSLKISADSALGATVSIRQRLNHSPSFLRNNFVSGTVTASIISGGASSLSMSYVTDTSVSTLIIPTTSITNDGAYHVIKNNVEITDFVNTAADSGYIDIIITIPTSRSIALSSIQIAGTSKAGDVAFLEESVDRQKDHLFHYYEDAVVHQPKSNLLTGWTFAQNPWQFRTTALTNVATNTYTADQTIIIQQNIVDTNSGNNVSVGQSSFGSNLDFKVTAVTATNKFMMLQYIDPLTIQPYWGQKLSVRVVGRINSSHVPATTLNFKVRLMYKAGLPSATSRLVPVGDWLNTDNSIPDISGDGWTYITTDYDPTFTFTDTNTAFDSNAFQLPVSTNANMTLGVAIFMMNNMDSTATADTVGITRVSLVYNDFAIDADPMTYDESVRRCQYYYSKTFPLATVPAQAATQVGAITYRCHNTGAHSDGVWWQFPTVMRSIPTITAYNTNSANSKWYNGTGSADSGTSSVISGTASSSGAFINNTQVGGDNLADLLIIQASADARLG